MTPLRFFFGFLRAARSGEKHRTIRLPLPSQHNALASGRSRIWTLWTLLTAAVILLLLARQFYFRKPIPRAGAQFNLPRPRQRGSLVASGGILSPDSHYMVFMARDREAAQAHLYFKDMDSAELLPLGGTEGASDPFWSPASDMIGFFAKRSAQDCGPARGYSEEPSPQCQ